MRNYLDMLSLSEADLLTECQVRGVKRSLPKGYYVYSLWRDDLPTPTPFYIGKGKRRRCAIHFCPSTLGSNSIKDRILAKLERTSQPVRLAILGGNLSEDEAHNLERSIISRLGRIDIRTGPLANLTDGGEGMSGHKAPRGADSHRAQPVVVEGARFSCMAVAARELEMSVSAIRHRIEHGWPGYYRRNEGPLPQRKGRRRGAKHGRSRPVIANGVRYAMLSDAAEALGVQSSAIHKRINNGWPGYFYESEGQKPRSRPERKRKIVVEGRNFESITAASKALEIPIPTIHWRINSDDFSSYYDQ